MFPYSDMQHPVQGKDSPWIKTVAPLAGHPSSLGTVLQPCCHQSSPLLSLEDTERTPELFAQSNKTLGKQQTEPEEQPL